jgi:hypothetical protein
MTPAHMIPATALQPQRAGLSRSSRLTWGPSLSVVEERGR